MPVPGQTLQDSLQKYGVFLSDSMGGTYTLNKRCVLQNFRTQTKGLGSGGITIKQHGQVNEYVDGEIKAGQFVKILDTTTFADTEYGSVGDELFFGTVASVTVDNVEDSPDNQGQARINEIGHYYSTLPIIWTGSPQVFNPIVGGTAYGNKKSTSLDFEPNPHNMASVDLVESTTGSSLLFPSDGPEAGGLTNQKVWSLEQFLTYMAGVHGVYVAFPWTYDNEQAALQGIPSDPNVEDKYKSFKNSVEVKQYNHYDGMSFQELLQDVITEPFDWFIRCVSNSGPTFQIVNKAPVDMGDIGPAATLIEYKIDNDLTTNFNTTQSDEVYDRVIYRGNYILVSGTLNHWNNNSSASMIPGWTSGEEQAYITTNQEHDDLTFKSMARATDKKVYRQYVYKNLTDDCPIQIAKDIVSKPGAGETPFTGAPFYPSGNGSVHYTMTPFFPRIDFYDVKPGNIFTLLDTPIVYTSLTTHKTPPLLELTWADTLPWKKFQQKEMATPFVVATTFKLDSSSSDPLYFNVDLCKPGPWDSITFKHTYDGYQLDMNYPENLAYADSNLFKMEGSVVDQAIQYWVPSDLSNRNPTATPLVYEYFTSYKTMASTVAGYSSQRLEFSIDNPTSTSGITKIKIIEDLSLECWFAHAGTIKNAIAEPIYNDHLTDREYVGGFERYLTDTFIRNDNKKVYNLAIQASKWVFTPKISAKIDLAMMNYVSGSVQLGQLFAKVTDKTIVRPVNTAVCSIEYDCVENRIYISTALPQMPTWKKIAQTPISKSVISPSTDSKSATVQQAPKVITKQDYPTHGTIAGGSVGGAAAEPQDSHLYSIINGNALSWIGGVGVKHVITDLRATVAAFQPNMSNGTPTTLPDGWGWARDTNDNSFVVIINDINSKTQYDIKSTTVVFADVSVAVTGSSGSQFYAQRPIAAM